MRFSDIANPVAHVDIRRKVQSFGGNPLEVGHYANFIVYGRSACGRIG